MAQETWYPMLTLRHFAGGSIMTKMARCHFPTFLERSCRISYMATLSPLIRRIRWQLRLGSPCLWGKSSCRSKTNRRMPKCRMKNWDKEGKVPNWRRPRSRKDSSINIRICSYSRRVRNTISSKTAANLLVCDKSPQEHSRLVRDHRTGTLQVNRQGSDPNRIRSYSRKISQSCIFIGRQPWVMLRASSERIRASKHHTCHTWSH